MNTKPPKAKNLETWPQLLVLGFGQFETLHWPVSCGELARERNFGLKSCAVEEEGAPGFCYLIFRARDWGLFF